jgi:hypothetical protein
MRQKPETKPQTQPHKTEKRNETRNPLAENTNKNRHHLGESRNGNRNPCRPLEINSKRKSKPTAGTKRSRFKTQLILVASAFHKTVNDGIVPSRRVRFITLGKFRLIISRARLTCRQTGTARQRIHAVAFLPVYDLEHVFDAASSSLPRRVVRSRGWVRPRGCF